MSVLGKRCIGDAYGHAVGKVLREAATTIDALDRPGIIKNAQAGSIRELASFAERLPTEDQGLRALQAITIARGVPRDRFALGSHAHRFVSLIGADAVAVDADTAWSELLAAATDDLVDLAAADGGAKREAEGALDSTEARAASLQANLESAEGKVAELQAELDGAKQEAQMLRGKVDHLTASWDKDFGSVQPKAEVSNGQPVSDSKPPPKPRPAKARPVKARPKREANPEQPGGSLSPAEAAKAGL